MGAANFLVKPVRMAECKALIQQMRRKATSVDKAEKGLAKYETLRDLGAGAAGSVSLVRNKIDGKDYALKTINLTYLTERDRKNAESEVQFLRVLHGPTLIQFHESFIEKNNIYIAMEYAENGSLDQLIRKNLERGSRFKTEEIISYISQISLGVMAMHSKNILHRDIKTQNIFITKENILKIGDFGISRQLDSTNQKAVTACGTPYFMPPEVCQGMPYDSKADVWAVGVILYELITLKKPFDSESISGVFDKIVNQQLDPLPSDVDVNLRTLIAALLNKDYSKRPNIFDVAQIPCIRNAIEKFIDEHNCREDVAGHFTSNYKTNFNQEFENANKEANATNQQHNSEYEAEDGEVHV